MKIIELATDLYDSLFGKRDFFAMRSSLRDHFREKGMKVGLIDDDTLVIDKCISVKFIPYKNYAECKLSYGCDAEDYTSLDNETKAFIATRVNGEADKKGHHTLVYAYEDVFYIKTSFYFTRMRMMYELFFQHYDELDNAINLMAELVTDAKKE